jgi:uncharacterized protein
MTIVDSRLKVESVSVSPQFLDRPRIVELDVLRGLAVLGILPMNIQSFAMIGAAYLNPTADGNLHGMNFYAWLLSHLLADQKFITIFCMLFGAGIFLMAHRAEANGQRPAMLHYRRMFWLIVFGVLHAYLLWSGDILYDYGICGLLVYLFRNRRPRTLIILGMVLLTVTPIFMGVCGKWLATLPSPNIQSIREQLWQPTPAEKTKEITAYRGGWIRQMSFRAPDAFAMETTYFLVWGFWREMGFMLIGIALLKLGVLNAKRSPRFYWNLIGLAVLVGIPLTLWGSYRDFALHWDFIYSLFYGTEFNYWGSMFISLGWVGAVILMVRSRAGRVATNRLAAVGRMAFTNYIMQTIIGTTIFFGHGFGFFGSVPRKWQFAIVLAVWMLQLAVSPIWLRRFNLGPLEWLWRSLTCLRWEPFRIRRGTASLLQKL